MEKIYISGTGRCETTFLNFNTGVTKDNYSNYIFKNCNSCMEKRYNDNHYIIKNPTI